MTGAQLATASPHQKRYIPPQARVVCRLVAERYWLTPKELRQKTQRPRISRPRMVAMWMLRDLGWSYPEIAEVFRCHHTSVIYAVRLVSREMSQRDELVSRDVMAIQSKLRECAGIL